MSAAWESSHGPVRAWRSGAWSLELRDDELADLAWHGRPVLRSVRAVARDHDWGTVQFEVEGLEEAARDDGLGAGSASGQGSASASLILRVHSAGLGASLRGTVRADPLPDGGIRIACDLESAEPFDTNRTGLVVLHPPRLAGTPLRVAHASAAEAEAISFPTAISPHQPACDIAGLAWHHDGLSVEVAFAGDVFEMEDQRNWTDASFKTYNRPLALPFPYRLEAGERVRQSVTVRVRETQPAASDVRADRIETREFGAFPEIGVCAATAPDPAPDFTPLGSFTIVELDLATSNWEAALDRARKSRLPLDVRVICSGHDSDAFETLAARLGEAQLAGTRILRGSAYDPDLHVSTGEATAALRRCLERAGVPAPVLGGSRSHFTELNREHHRLPAGRGALDGVATTVTPLFHSLTTEQLIESVVMQRLVAEQTARLARDRLGVADPEVVFGPILLRPRFNNVATAPQPHPAREDLSEGYGAEFTGDDDPRQNSPELAAWVVASAAALAAGGATALAFFEEWGPRGLRTRHGNPLPAFEAIAELSELSGERLLAGQSADGLLWVCGGRSESGDRVLVANIDRVPRIVRVILPEEHLLPGDGAGSETETEVPLAAYSWRAVVIPRA